MLQNKKAWALVGLALMSGCTSMEKRSEDPEKKPLAKLESPISIESAWNRSMGSGVGKSNVKLSVEKLDNQLITIDHKGLLTVTDSIKGTIVWQKKLNKSITAGPAVGNGVILVAANDNEILAHRASDGKQLWRAGVTSEVLAQPAIADNVAFIHTLDGGLTALDLTNGRQLWRYAHHVPTLILRRSATPVIADHRVIVGFASGKVVALNRLDGSVDWERTVSDPKGYYELKRMVDISAQPIVDNDVLYVAGYQGKLAALSVHSGDILWTRDIPSLSGLTLKGDKLFVAGMHGNVFAVDKVHGRTFWKQDALLGRKLSRPVVQGNQILLGDEDGYLHWLNMESGELVARVHTDKKGLEAEPIVMNKRLFVYTRGGKLAALETTQRNR